MNGKNDDYEYDMPDDHRPDDDDGGPERTDIPCPYCDHMIEWTGARLVCDNCEVFWLDADEVARDRASVEAGYR